MTYWPTFGQMRKDGRRDWYRMSDLVDAAAIRGAAFTRYQVRGIIAHLPKPTVKAYGHWHYTEAHRQAVIKAAILAAAANHSEIPTSSTPRGAIAMKTKDSPIAGMSLKDDQLLNTRQAAALVGRTPKTLIELRSKRVGPRCLKMGTSKQARTYYRRSDLERWISENAHVVGGVHKEGGAA